MIINSVFHLYYQEKNQIPKLSLSMQKNLHFRINIIHKNLRTLGFLE